MQNTLNHLVSLGIPTESARLLAGFLTDLGGRNSGPKPPTRDEEILTLSYVVDELQQTTACMAYEVENAAQ